MWHQNHIYSIDHVHKWCWWHGNENSLWIGFLWITSVYKHWRSNCKNTVIVQLIDTKTWWKFGTSWKKTYQNNACSNKHPHPCEAKILLFQHLPHSMPTLHMFPPNLDLCRAQFWVSTYLLWLKILMYIVPGTSAIMFLCFRCTHPFQLFSIKMC